MNIVERAKALYRANGSHQSHPVWDQLGDVTKSVWIEKAERAAAVPVKKVKVPKPFVSRFKVKTP